jgi:hypothetical protein
VTVSTSAIILFHCECRRRVPNSAKIAIKPGSTSANIAPEPPPLTGGASLAVEGAEVVIRSESVPLLPDPFNLPKAQAAPLGNPLHENLNELLSNPETESVVAPAEPGAPTARRIGLAEILGVTGTTAGAFVDPGFTPSQSVIVCTRLPLVANTVIGTLCAFAEEYAVRVRVELPLTSVAGLNDAATPEGSPGAESVTVPKPNDLSCSGMLRVPFEDIA